MSEYKADSVRSHKFTENKRSNMIPCGNKLGAAPLDHAQKP